MLGGVVVAEAHSLADSLARAHENNISILELFTTIRLW